MRLLVLALLLTLPLAAAQNATVELQGDSLLVLIDGREAARFSHSPLPSTHSQHVPLALNLTAEVRGPPFTGASDLAANTDAPVSCAQGAPKCSGSFALTYAETGRQTLALHAFFETPANLTLDPAAGLEFADGILHVSRTHALFIEAPGTIKQANEGDITGATREAQRDHVTALFPGATDETISGLLDKAARAKAALSIHKEVEVGEARTTFRVRIQPPAGRPVFGVTIYEDIPKRIALSVSELRFGDLPLAAYEAAFPTLYPGKGNYVQVLKDDPLLVWHFAEVDAPLTVEYSVSGHVEGATNTLVTAEEAQAPRRGSPWLFIAIGALILIPVALLGPRYLPRRRRRPTHTEVTMQVNVTPQKSGQTVTVEADKKTFEGHAVQDEHVLKLQIYIKERLAKGHPKHQIKEDVLSVHWPEELVDEIFKRLGV